MRLFLLITTLFITYTQSLILSCYYVHNNPPVADVDVNLCTHIMLIGETFLEKSGNFPEPKGQVIADVLSLKKRKPSLKLLLSITGSNPAFSNLSSNDEIIRKFASDSSRYLRKYGLDGIDIDWEFPTWSSDAKETDRVRFTRMLELLREAFGNSLLLTAAVSGPSTITETAYDIPGFNRYLDLVNVMNYDFHVFDLFKNPLVGFNAPLRKLRLEFGLLGKMNSEYSMETYARLGLWQNKTLFGIPTYNLATKLLIPFLHIPYSPATRNIYGFDKQIEVCNLTQNSDYHYVWNSDASSPYIYGNGIWISLEDERSVREKAAFGAQISAGIMAFHIGADDVYGACGKGKYPLLSAIKKVMLKKSMIISNRAN